MLHVCLKLEVGVSKNKGTPKWMVKIMENPIKMDDLGVPLFLKTLWFNTQAYLHHLSIHESTWIF